MDIESIDVFVKKKSFKKPTFLWVYEYFQDLKLLLIYDKYDKLLSVDDMV